MIKSLVAVRTRGGRSFFSKGLITVVASLFALGIAGWLFAPSSVSTGAVLGMIPFAAVLAIAGLGQMLVVQQGGIDLSVPGGISLAVVVVSHYPTGNDALLLPAVGIALTWAVGAGLLNGFLIGWLRLNAIIATLGTNALLFGAVLGISGGTPRTTTDLLHGVATDSWVGVPNSLLIALVILAIVLVLTKKTVAGRRFEAVGASGPAATVAGLRVKRHNGLAYVWAQVLYMVAGILLAGITKQPTAWMGNEYLLPSVAVVVLAGTSLLGGRGFPAATLVAAIFLKQLDQFVLALGVPYAVRTLLQAAALAVGVGIYTIDWGDVRRRFFPSHLRGDSDENS